MPRRSFFVLKSYYRMAVDIEFFLTWLPAGFLWREKLVKFRNCCFVIAWSIYITWMIEPLSAVEGTFFKFLYKKSGREKSFTFAEAYIVLSAASVAAGNVVIRISEVYNNVKSH